MTDINELVDKVVKKETNSLEEQVKRKKVELKTALKAKEEDYATKLNNEKIRISQKMDEQYQIAKQSQMIHYRDQLLKEKQTILNDVFNTARTELDQMTESDFKRFLLGVLSEFQGQGDMTLILGELSKGLIDSAWLNSQAVEGLRVGLSTESIQGKGGFVLEQAGSKYNFLNESLIEEVRTGLTIEISRLFNS